MRLECPRRRAARFVEPTAAMLAIESGAIGKAFKVHKLREYQFTSKQEIYIAGSLATTNQL